MKAIGAIATVAVISSAIGLVGACGSDDAQGNGTGGASSGGGSAGGATATGGRGETATGGTPNGGSGGAASGATGGTASGGSGGTASGGAASGGAASGGAASGGAASGGAASGGNAATGGAAPDGGGGRRYSTNPDDFFGASRCASANVLFCDDFESDSIKTDLWKTKFSAPSLDTAHVARGKKSLHLSTTASGGSGLETTKIFPAPKNTYYGRLFVWFDVMPTAPSGAHWTIMGANPTGDSPIKGEIRVGGQFDGTINRWGVGTDGGPTGDWTNWDQDPKGAIKGAPNKAWTCVEWMHKGDTNESRVWLDGVEHPSLATTRDVKHGANKDVKYDLPTFASVWVGWVNYNQGKTIAPDHYDTWIDEVALDDERIGCDL
jgi:hypothetical protein